MGHFLKQMLAHCQQIDNKLELGIKTTSVNPTEVNPQPPQDAKALRLFEELLVEQFSMRYSSKQCSVCYPAMEKSSFLCPIFSSHGSTRYKLSQGRAFHVLSILHLLINNREK